MKLFLCSLVAFLATAAWLLQGQPPAPSSTHQVRLNGHTFTLPTGFEIELAAAPPLVDRPINADFDEQGRLYVSDSSGSNENVNIQLVKKPHRIVRLESTRGDGKFDRRTIFADKMMFPEGTLWHAGSLYVAAPPSIWKLTDTDGDGIADERVEWFKGKTLTGCANDLHGPYLGPDGWIYWGKGAFAQQTYDRPGRKPLNTRAAHIIRAKPDGTGAEPVMTGGMDNPVGVAFTPGGERIFTTTFLQYPGGGRRDGLIHAVYGGVYGKNFEDVLRDHPRTSPDLMPVLVHLGAAAPSGLARYDSRVFGADYQDNLFACCFNMQKITRHVLEADGASFKSVNSDFLVSDNKDFHPTDVLMDADGSLLVVDTGGWYKLCCPTSQLVKPDVLGAIYRVRRSGAPKIDDPRGLKLAWNQVTPAELANLLGDVRPAVRRRAIQALAAKGTDALTVLDLRPDRSALARRNMVWTATRIADPDARAVVKKALKDADETVRQAALHSVALWRDRTACTSLVDLLKSASLHNRRGAAEAMGRIGVRAAVSTLLAAVAEAEDRHVEHSLIFALIEIADRSGTRSGLKSDNARVRHAALIALDQMEDDEGAAKVRLSADDVIKEISSSDPRLRETAWWIASRHPEWGGALKTFLQERLAGKLQAAEADELVNHLAKLARSPHIESLLADRLGDLSASRAEHEVVLRAMTQARLKETPANWLSALEKTLAGKDAEVTRASLMALRSLTLKKTPESLQAAVKKIAQNDKLPAEVSLLALTLVPDGLTGSQFALVRAEVKGDRPINTRSLAAEVLSRAPLGSKELLDLVGILPEIGPMELDRVLNAFAQSSDAEVGQRLLATLKTLPARSALRTDQLQRCLAKFGPVVQKDAEPLYLLINADAGKQKAKLEQLLSSLEPGDIRRGQAVFNSAKAACASCHAIGYLGGNVGPDLTRIGQIRTQRDLLESIVFPSASFVRSFEPVTVITKAGKSFNGILRRDNDDGVLLVLGANQESFIPRADIEEMQPSRVSVMPSGLDQQLSPRDLADLVAFLKACK